jgi:uncharacterized protein
VEFEWDPQKAERNLRKQRVGFEKAVTVFLDPDELTIYDPDHSLAEERFVSVGRSAVGRLLVVGYTERRSKIRISFARRATLTERHDNDMTTKKRDDEPGEEYDFRGGTRGRHSRQMGREGAVVRLDPDVAERFPTSEAVNRALRSIPVERDA